MVLAALGVPIVACDCIRLSICNVLESAPVIFVGEVIDGGITSIRQDPWYANPGHARFRVLENFRGLPKDAQTVDVELSPSGGMCGPLPYYSRRTYLVIPQSLNGKFVDGGCSSSRDVLKDPADIQTVRNYFAGRERFNVSGGVAVAPFSDLAGFLLEQGEAKPLAGVTVSTTQNGTTFSALTDADGHYTLPLPYTGSYTLRAGLDPYASEVVAAPAPSHACAEQDFGLRIDNTISGQVLDAAGNPVKRGRVGLIDLDRHSADPWSRHVWFNEAYVEDRSAFTFGNVPIGRYLLVFNPDGPLWQQIFDQAFESTYYPSGSTRANAKVIQVKSGGTHLTDMNLTMGPRVESREVTVRVRFADGAPMTTAEIRCIGVPLHPGEPEWWTQGGYLVDPEQPDAKHFFAPANRKLRIELRDRYGRDLKKPYVAEFAPGTSPISQEFVVEP